MKAELDAALGVAITQADFAELIGVSGARVSQMMSEGLLDEAGTGQQWLADYCKRLRDQASGRDADGVLSKERAALSREQRIGQEIKNRIAMGEYAPIGLLGDVLALASAAVVDRFDALPGQLRKACPDLPAEARDAIAKTIASARNEWIRSTADLVDRQLEQLADVTGADAAPDEPDADLFDDALTP